MLVMLLITAPQYVVNIPSDVARRLGTVIRAQKTVENLNLNQHTPVHQE